MPKTRKLSKQLLKRIAEVTNKRARFVLDRIVKEGLVTTEEIASAGYEHPPRAARDVRELGFHLETIRVKHSNGRYIAGYVLDEAQSQLGKSGRRILPKKVRDEIIEHAHNQCQICSAAYGLQVDHCVPYEVGGEPEGEKASAYSVLCGSCNRKKSWDCEHCANWLGEKDPAVCLCCYWANPASYSHVAMMEQRRVDLVWSGAEVNDFERIKRDAGEGGLSVAEQIKRVLKRSLAE